MFVSSQVSKTESSCKYICIYVDKTTKNTLDVTENLQLLEMLPFITSERELTNNHFSYLKKKKT